MGMLDTIELRERVRALEDLVRDLYDNLWTHWPQTAGAFDDRMRELGVRI